MEEDSELGYSEAALHALQELLKEQGIRVAGDVDAVKSGLAELRGQNHVTDDDDECDSTPKMKTEEYHRTLADLHPAVLTLSLIAEHHSLWGEYLWNGSKLLAGMIDGAEIDVKNKSLLELGAGAGLPSLIAALNGARVAVITDYATQWDSSLLVPIQQNIEGIREFTDCIIRDQGYVWGNDVQPLLDLNNGRKFDLLILADLIFNRSEHRKLLWTCQQCLGTDGIAWVSFNHHDPEKAANDLNFFELAGEYNLKTSFIKQITMRDVFEENDGLDSERDKTFVYTLEHNT